MTSTYLTNASFETGDLTGWTTQTAEDTKVTTSTGGYTTSGLDGTYLFNTWWHGYPITQKTTKALPQGYYTLTALAATTGGYLTIFVKDADDSSEIAAKQYQITESGSFSPCSVSFTINEEQSVIIGMRNSNNASAYDDAFWYKADNFQLFYTDLLAGVKSAYTTALENAKTTAATTNKVSTTLLTELKSAIETYGSVESSVSEDYTNATTALDAAREAVERSIATYSLIAAGTIPTNSTDGWAVSTAKGALACNTWSTEANTDGSGMATPFIQDWANSGTALGAGKLYYTLEGLNPEEAYNITALVRVFNEAAGSLEGGSFFATGATSVDIYANGTACSGDFSTKGIYGTYNLKGVVDSEGKLQFGIEISESSELNWVAIKNVTISEFAGQKVESITLSQSSAALTTGDALTLTATVAPENADDKTFTWYSSNDAVATVSANGVVAAIAAGTATITATANDGSEVSTSCTVTIADATAPSFYSSEIAAGDYYIVNAATGKFLGGANDWGTQASLINHGVPFTAALNDGKYTLDSHTYNSTTAHFFNGTYVDQGATNLYIVSLGEGKFSISTADGSAFVTATAGSTIVANTAANASSSLAQWYFLSKNDRDKMLAAATEANPADATYYIKEANISRNLRESYGKSGWTNISYGEDKNQSRPNYNAQVWNATVDVYQEIADLPNGTYTLNMQGFCSGSVKLYANDVEIDVPAQNDGITSQSAAATAFGEGKYVNTLTVTVTDRTLKIGLKGDCSSGKWLCYDNFELLMTKYIPVTGITASIEPEGDIEIGNTAKITFATNPTPASFDKLSIVSNNEAVATVNETGLVTAIAEGTATITITADEMESFTKTFEIKVVKPAVIPSTVTLNETEVALDATTTTATLTATVGAEGAPQAVVWTSANENVATVANGVVTAVLPGTTTIRATALNYDAVYAEATVTVTYQEATVPESTYENDGARRYIYTLGDNLIKNGSFEYPNAFYGWTSADNFSSELKSSKFTSVTEDGETYLKGTVNEGGDQEGSIGTAWSIKPGKTYQFSYRVKSLNSASGNQQYLVTSLTNTKGTESKVLGTPSVTAGQWTTVNYSFINGEEGAEDCYKYIQVKFRWLSSNFGFDNFYLCEAITETEGNIDYATAAIPTNNIGDEPFQIKQSAIDAANALVQGTATVAEVEAAYEAVTTLNAPEATQAYHLVFNCEGHNATGNALTLIPNPAQTQGLYGLKYLAPENTNLAQAFYFTHTTGNKYKLHAIDQDGKDRYITTQAEGYATSWYEAIRTTDDANKAMAVEIRPNGEGLYLLWNTGANKAIAHNGNTIDDMFTNNTANFQFVETTQASVTINTTAAGWGTTMLPFAVASLPTDVKAYTCAEVNGNSLTLVEVTALEANKPYIIEGTWNETLTGDAQGTALSYKDGLLTGTYADIDAPNGSYVLQNQSGKVGFYQVDTDTATPKVKANRAYMTAPATEARRAAYFFGGETTSVVGVMDALLGGEGVIYNAAGVQQQRLQKGMNVIVLPDGSSRKVMVK